VDGDGRPEIVASDMSAGLHIWRRTKSGHLHRVRPHRALPESVGLSDRGVTRPVGDTTDLPAAGSDSVPTADTPARSTIQPPDTSALQSSSLPAAVADPDFAPSSSRAPPVSF